MGEGSQVSAEDAGVLRPEWNCARVPCLPPPRTVGCSPQHPGGAPSPKGSRGCAEPGTHGCSLPAMLPPAGCSLPRALAGLGLAGSTGTARGSPVLPCSRRPRRGGSSSAEGPRRGLRLPVCGPAGPRLGLRMPGCPEFRQKTPAKPRPDSDLYHPRSPQSSLRCEEVEGIWE